MRIGTVSYFGDLQQPECVNPVRLSGGGPAPWRGPPSRSGPSDDKRGRSRGPETVGPHSSRASAEGFTPFHSDDHSVMLCGTRRI
jgi:hypothetical protein